MTRRLSHLSKDGTYARAVSVLRKQRSFFFIFEPPAHLLRNASSIVGSSFAVLKGTP